MYLRLNGLLPPIRAKEAGRNEEMTVERPAGVIAVAAAFFLAAAYLLVVGLTMLARPGLISMVAGAALLGGLELAGPYMFLLMAGVGLRSRLRALETAPVGPVGGNSRHHDRCRDAAARRL